MSVVFSLAWEKNPMLRLSGDQKGKDPSFVPGSGVYVPVVPTAINRPSGEIAEDAPWSPVSENDIPDGGRICAESKVRS